MMKSQMQDQTAKGGILGIICYVLWHYDVDPVLIGLLTPVMSAALAWVSTKVGDKELASFFN